ncbi:AEC family transporter [Mycoplasmopsis adleri]|uniref:AEC family transporter n=1 Tax=Mycoplasmopsis adleri TaxID=51362 RepID=UPI003873BB17
MKIAIPALVLIGFMQSINKHDIKEQAIILGISFLFYSLTCLIAYLWVRFWPNKLPNSVIENSNDENNNSKTEANLIANNDSTLGLVASKVGDQTTKISMTKYKMLVIWMMLIFGSTTFFGLPIIDQMYRANGGLLAANISTIPYRIFLYSFCFIQMSNIKINKNNIKESSKQIFLTPIIICTFVGLILWLTQLIPGAGASVKDTTKNIDINGSRAILEGTFGENFHKIYAIKESDKTNWYIFKDNSWTLTNAPVGWFELNTTMKYLYIPINIISKLCSPLIWLVIGISLAESNLKTAIKDKWVWIYSILKLIVIPLIVLLLFWAFNKKINMNRNICMAMLIFAATPASTVVTGYAINSNKEVAFTTCASALSTVFSIFILPIFIVVGELVFV